MSEQRHPTLVLIDKFNEEWPRAEYGPAHIVLSDYNLEDEWLDICWNNLDIAKHLVERGEFTGTPPSVEELTATMDFLRTLKAIPEDERFWWDD